MSRHRRRKGAVNLPKAVHRVVSRGHEYFYFQAGRGTDHAEERVALPKDPQSPEFWNAIRQAQGVVGAVPIDTMSALIDAYEAAWPTLPRKLSPGTHEQYRRSMSVVRKAWGDLRAEALRPSHVQALMDAMAAGRANNVLDALRAMCRWGMGPRDLLSPDPTVGVARFEGGEVHKPWTVEQLRVADEKFTGMLRRGYVLGRYTGQRISDVVRLGFTDIDDGGFALRQKKTGVQPWCPIFPELEAEMATWEKRPGPFLLRQNGKPFPPHALWKLYDRARDVHRELKDTVTHGLRLAVICHRQAGRSIAQICDMLGMSPPIVERYCRHADRKAGGQAVLLELKQGRTTNKTVKR